MRPKRLLLLANAALEEMLQRDLENGIDPVDNPPFPPPGPPVQSQPLAPLVPPPPGG